MTADDAKELGLWPEMQEEPNFKVFGASSR